MNHIDILGSLAVKITAIITVIAGTAGYVDIRYAYSSDLKTHMVASDLREVNNKIEHYEDKIAIEEDALAVLEAKKTERPLTSEEALVESQRKNRKARYLRKLEGISPR